MDNRCSRSVSIAQIMRMVVEENRKFVPSSLCEEFSIAGQQVMITACSMSALSKKTCSYPLSFVQRLMGK
jgi:hypothetical protein